MRCSFPDPFRQCLAVEQMLRLNDDVGKSPSFVASILVGSSKHPHFTTSLRMSPTTAELNASTKEAIQEVDAELRELSLAIRSSLAHFACMYLTPTNYRRQA